MKKIAYILFLIYGIVLLPGCEGVTTEDTSRLTYFVKFDLIGGEDMLIPVGTSFTDPGFVATEQGKDVTSSAKVEGLEDIDPNRIGIYEVTYSAINVDGFPSSAVRRVFVYNPDVKNDISGKYITDKTTNRLTVSTGAIVEYSGYELVITETPAPGIFHVSDFFGAYYYPRLSANNYVSAHTMTGYISLNTDNSIDHISSFTLGWRNSLTGFANGLYDPLKDNVTWDAKWSNNNLIFHVSLTKKP